MTVRTAPARPAVEILAEQLAEHLAARKQRQPVHMSVECCNPVTRTLCGLPLSPTAREAPATSLECVVCAEIKAVGPMVCPNCQTILTPDR